MIIFETNFGNIEIELFADKAPKTCENFVTYVKEGFYDGLIFHRVIPGFMVQGGGFDADMNQRPTNPTIENEANNGLSNDEGTLAMARTMDPHSASGQFFVNVANNNFLNFRAENMEGWGYCVFAKVSGSMDAVNQIKAVKTGNAGGHQDVPVEPVMIIKAYIQD
jgi:peptidyl-prolyl cis-trans isomerase B (cyclophilin B)